MIILYVLIMVTIGLFGQLCHDYRWASLFWNVYGITVTIMNISLIFTFDKWYNSIRIAWYELLMIIVEE